MVFNLNTNGTVASYHSSYNYEAPTGTTLKVAGIEFTSGSDKLAFSTFDPSWSTTYNAVYLWDFTNNTSPSAFSSSSDFGRSAIEMGKDANMYVARSNGLHKLNLSGLTISSVITGIIIYKTSNIFTLHDPNTTRDCGIYNLPDQIDGKVIEYFNLSQTAYTVKRGKLNWNKTVNVPIGGANWTKSSHALTTKGEDKVYVLGILEFRQLSGSSSGIMSMDGMEVQFYTDAECNVYQGAGIHLKGTTFKGMDCGLMWKGVDLRKEGSKTTKSVIKMELKTSNSASSYIMDAYNGIKTIGKWASIEIKSYAVFDRNEIGINVLGIEPANIAVNGAIMIGATPLRDQTKGFNFYPDYDDYLKRTITHIVVNKSNVVIGSLTGAKNWLHDAQHGIKAVASSLQLYNSEIDQDNQLFSTTVAYWPKYGVWFNANKEANKHELKIIGCKFYNIQQGVRIENLAKRTTIRQNEFNTTYAYAIEYTGNLRGGLDIGYDGLNSANTFTSCNWAAIQCWGNSAAYIKPTSLNPDPINTEIKIWGNTIDNHTYATGIAVAEPVLGTRGYGFIVIGFNKIGLNQRVGQGIVLKQIVGANPVKPLSNNNDIAFRITSNTINFSTTSNKFYNGILSENSNKLNFIQNEIHSGTFGDWRNVGIACSEGINNLVYGNTVQAGKGLMVKGNGIFSNYYCNNFNQCVNGIQLLHNVLRNKSGGAFPYDDTIHSRRNPSTSDIFGRPNIFNNGGANPITWGADIDVYNNTIRNNRWDFVNGKVPVITISIPPPPNAINTIVKNNNRIDPCISELPEIPPPVYNQVNIDYNGIADSVMTWKLKYTVNRANQEGQTTQWVNNTNIIAIQKMEDSIQAYRYVVAKTILDNFTPGSAIDSAFKAVFSIWINNRLILDTVWLGHTVLISDTAWADSVNYAVQSIFIDTVSYSLHAKQLTDNEVGILTNIAQLDAVLVNPAAYPARAILWGEKHLQFSDPIIPFYPNIEGYVLAPCIGGGDTGIVIKLYDSIGVFTGIKTKTLDSGFFIIEGTKLNTLNLRMKYYISAMLSNGTVNTGKATYNELALQSYHTFACTEPLNKRKTGINQFKKEAIVIYPNPSYTGFILTNMPESWTIRVNEMMGKIIWEKDGSGNTSIPNGILAKGIYTIVITNASTNEQVSKKLLVQ